MKKLEIQYNKTLKLTNVLSCPVDMGGLQNMSELDLIITRMQNTVRVKHAKQIGPFIQYTKMIANEEKTPEIALSFCIQCDRLIQEVEKPYTMTPIVRVPNCMYCRYIGPESKQNFAYDKIFMEAFERDIPLTGNTYTILVNRSEEDETVTVDVFMERADEYADKGIG